MTYFGSQPVNLILGYYKNSHHPQGGAESQTSPAGPWSTATRSARSDVYWYGSRARPPELFSQAGA